ncbi:MAG: extracellular solute-binding protein [Chloroflexota bacterium]|nr:MAG: extracellular solute-binding protein [Chloroflexota bacterium]
MDWVYDGGNIINRYLTLPFLLVLISLVLQSCAQDESQPTDMPVVTKEPEIEPSPTLIPVVTEESEDELTGQVSLWHSLEEREMASLSTVIATFQEIHPDIEFDILYVPSYDNLNKFETSARNGGGPCILLGAYDWGPSLFDSNLIRDVTEFTNEEFLSNINPVALGSVQYSKAIIGLPLNTTGVVLFRNKRIIPEAPTTFDELVTIAQESTSGDEVGAYLDYGLFFSGGHLNGVGGQLMDADGNPTFNDEKGIEWIELVQRFEEAGPIENNNDSDINLFVEDKVGLILAGFWNAANLSEAIGMENLAIDPWPVPMSGYVQTENLYLNSNSSNNELRSCWAFMEFLLSVEAQEIFADPSMAGSIPSITQVNLADPFQMQVVEVFNGGTTFPILPEMSFYWEPLNSALFSVMEQGIEPADALQNAFDIIIAELESNQEE